ncbi:MAG: threonylcarbamoyl-AMP synthase [Candidatus Levybacteria bacterium]|nr:threonylcarbamoyl-AMP synthase [Candidatus Levybacteria bacterium]
MNNIDEAIEVIRGGGIVILPTDTAFGISCRIDDEKAVKRLFEARKRPVSQATPVLFDSIERVREFVSFDSKIEELMNKFWPGALTIVLKCDISKVPELVRGGGENLGVRIPDHEIPRKIVEGVGMPILGPSANFHGEPTPYKFEELDNSLIKLVDLVVEGKTKGENLASTVIDCTEEPWKIIRQGAVKIDL